MSVHAGPDIVESGLVLHLDAANGKSYPGSGTSLSDLSGNNNHGTLNGSPAFSSDNGGSIVFDGVNDTITINGVAPVIQNDFTFMSWAKRDGNSTTSSGGIFGNHWHTEFSGANIYFQNSNTYVRLSAGNGTTRPAHNVNIPITNSNWNHYTIRYTGTTYQFYFNGALLDSRTAAVVQSANSNQFILGRWAASYSSEYYLNGKISSFISYNRALTAAEIAQNFNATRGRFGI